MAAAISSGTSVTFSGNAVQTQSCRITSSKNALDSTQLNSLVTTAIAGRPTITGSATIFSSQATGLTLAQQFSEASPSGSTIAIVINSPVTGLVYSGTAVITGFNPSWENDAIMVAEVTWQYTSTITVTRPTS
jgi:hypothetical protein